MSKEEGLLDWEVDFIQKIDPSIIRKRLHEEFDYLYSVGPITDAIKNDDVLSHILAYAWKSTYNIALVCKRFWIITKSRAYWAALAKHALKDEIPAPILLSLNFFYFAKDADPAHLFLQGLLKKKKFAQTEDKKCVMLFHPYDEQRKGRLSIGWNGWDNKSVLPNYFIEYSLVRNNQNGNSIYGELYTRIFFNYVLTRKLIWFEALTNDNKKVIRCVYCEVYDKDKNLTWHGQPGTTEVTSALPSGPDLYPNPNSLGVWK